ncbi:MAG TPA: S1 RNA-binding domain-containing protein [Chloroflexi bacterium]|nr:S1 RNA-binding domain-containing protein [Chloroflexota bacterium]
MPAERFMPVEENGTEENAQANLMAQMLEDYLSCEQLKRGEIVSGVVVRANDHEVIVDIGAKCEGIVPDYDLERLSQEEREMIQEGEEVMVFVVNPEDADDNIILSLSRAQIAQDWRKMKRLLKTQQIIESEVTGCNKGGLLVQIGKLRGFVPGSQLDATRVLRQAPSGSEGENRWAPLVGETIKLKVIEVDRQRNRLILSERAALRDWRKNQRERLLDELEEGEVRKGRVVNLVKFGAFVDMGGIDGLIHLSELSWKRVEDPREVVDVGQEVEVYVLSVDRERERIALSLKRLQDDPWESVEERYQEGQLVEGVVTRLTKWGAFASIVGDEAIEGLIHISELDEGQVHHPRDVVEADQVLVLRVIGIDEDRHRMALSLKQVDQGVYLDQDWQTMVEKQKTEPSSALSAALTDSRLAERQEGLDQQDLPA